MNHNTTGDGAITALQVLAIMSKTEKSLSKLSSVVPIYPQVLVNVPVPKPKSIEKFPAVMTAIKKAEKKLNTGRILVRPSGTESKIRVMVEGDNMHKITAIAEGLAGIIKSKMA
jgi:phosphoglucosamine mutase